MKGAGNGFTLANPTTNEFEDLHLQLQADKVITEFQFKTTVKTAKTRNSGYFDFLTRPYKARGKHWFSTSPRSLVIHTKDNRKVISTPLPALSNAADVAQALTDILESAKDRDITQLALPVFEYDGGGDIVDIMKKGIQDYLQKEPNWGKGAGQIKIIQPRPQQAAGAA